MSEVNKRTVCACCGKEYPTGAEICPVCGASADALSHSRVQPTEEKNENRWYSTILEKVEAAVSPVLNFLSSPRRMLSAVILFAVSLLMLLLAFAPIVYTKTDIDGLECSADYNSISIVEIGIISILSLHENDIANTDYYRELNEFENALDLGRVTMNDRSEVARAIKNTLCVYMLRYDTPVRVSGPIAAIAAVVYLILCTVLLISSAWALIGEIIAYVYKKEGSDTRLKKAVRMLWATLSFLPVLAYTSKQLFNFAEGSDIKALASYGSGVSWGFVLTAIIATLASLYFAAKAAVCAVREGGTVGGKKNELLSLVLAAAVLISTALPLISADLSWEIWGRGQEASVGIGVSDVCEITPDSVNYYARKHQSAHLDELGDIVTGYKTYGADAPDLLSRALIGCARFHPGFVYFAIVITTLIMLIAWAMLARKLLSSVLLGLSTGDGKAQKIFILLASLAQCAVALIMSIVANEALLLADSYTIVFGIGAGPTVALIASIGMLVASKKEDELKVEGGYDNADISHAPYVTI